MFSDIIGMQYLKIDLNLKKYNENDTYIVMQVHTTHKKKSKRFRSCITQRVFISMVIFLRRFYQIFITHTVYLFDRTSLLLSLFYSPIRIYRFYFTQRRYAAFTGPHKPQALKGEQIIEIENKIILCPLNRFIHLILLAHVNKLYRTIYDGIL